MFEHEVSQALPVQAREAEEVPRSQLGGIQRRAAPPGRFDSLVLTRRQSQNWKADKTGKPGGQRVYSDMAIETGLVVRMVYKLAYRQTEGLLALDRLASRARYRDPGLLDVVSALEVAPQEAGGFRKPRAINPST